MELTTDPQTEDTFTDEQQAAFAQLLAAHPGLTLLQIIEGPMGRKALLDARSGKTPKWINMKTPRLTDVMMANVGAAVLCLWLDGAEVRTLIGERKDPKNPGQFLLNGSGGGFVNLATKRFHPLVMPSGFGEQPAEGAVCEFGEENRRGENLPICVIDPDKLHDIPIRHQIDYRAVEDGASHFPTAVYMKYTWLDDEQRKAAQLHARMMADEDYRRAACGYSEDETERVYDMALREVAALPTQRFAHPNEIEAYRKLQELRISGRLQPHTCG